MSESKVPMKREWRDTLCIFAGQATNSSAFRSRDGHQCHNSQLADNLRRENTRSRSCLPSRLRSSSRARARALRLSIATRGAPWMIFAQGSLKVTRLMMRTTRNRSSMRECVRAGFAGILNRPFRSCASGALLSRLVARETESSQFFPSQYNLARLVRT